MLQCRPRTVACPVQHDAHRTQRVHEAVTLSQSCRQRDCVSQPLHPVTGAPWHRDRASAAREVPTLHLELYQDDVTASTFKKKQKP